MKTRKTIRSIALQPFSNLSNEGNIRDVPAPAKHSSSPRKDKSIAALPGMATCSLFFPFFFFLVLARDE